MDLNVFLKNFSGQMKLILKPGSSFTFGKPVRLLEQAKIIEQKFDSEPKAPAATDLDRLLVKVKQLWHEKSGAGLETLRNTELKWLPWILYRGESPKPVEQADLLECLVVLLERKGKRNVRKLIHVYLKYYEPTVAGTEVIRKAIHKFLTSYEGKDPRLHKWKNRAVLLFSSNGCQLSAKWIVDLNKKEKHENLREEISRCLEHIGLTGDLANGGFLRQVAREILNYLNKNFQEQNIKVLLNLLELATPPHQARFPDLIPEAASLLLTKAGYNAPLRLQDVLRPFFLRHLGDPRLPGRSFSWQQVRKEAITIFKQWISKEDLEFFFEVVNRSANEPKWQYRRRFWETYLPHIENTWVVLGKNATELIKRNPDLKAYHQERNYGELLGGAREQSIFLILMRGYVLVEWSHSGACRIWREQDFPFRFGEGTYRASEIRVGSEFHKQIHYNSEGYNWQSQLAGWIQRNTGVNPLQSYYLE